MARYLVKRGENLTFILPYRCFPKFLTADRHPRVYPKVSGLNQYDINNATINTGCEATQRVMEVKLARLTHKTAIQLRLVTESCTICSSHSLLTLMKRHKLFELYKIKRESIFINAVFKKSTRSQQICF
jgi:hypothetical protein